MIPAQLLQHFDRISDAPDAIPRLRRFILDLAVRGKLVEQDPADEPASKLLERIAAEKARANATGGIEGGENFSLFDLPKNWLWTCIGDVCSKTGSGSTPRGGKDTYKSSGVMFLRSQNVYNDGLRLHDVAFIDAQTHQKMAGTAVRPQDLLLNITGGSIGRCCRTPDDLGEANVNQHVAIIRPVAPEIGTFLHTVILATHFQSLVIGEQTGAGRGGLPKNRMDRIPVPLPPLAEQHRIVAKVDELMALCDRLEAARNEREARRDRLVTASLHRLNQPQDSGDAQADAAALADHARFHLHHLSRLSTRPDHIKSLRQTILNLAVRGKLVEQDPADEAVPALLNRVKQTQAALCSAGTLKKSVLNALVREIDLPYALPKTWLWVSLGQLIVFGPQNGLSPTPSTSPEAPRAVTLSATTSGTFNGTFYKHVDAEIPINSTLWLSPGDILFQRGNTPEYVGIAAVYYGERNSFIYPDLMMKVRTFEEVCIKYVHLASISPPARMYLCSNAAGAQATMPKINQDTLLHLPIPLPPLAEQHRIVARVDELMALCDRLEASLSTQEDTSRRLLESVLHHALAPALEEVAA